VKEINPIFASLYEQRNEYITAEEPMYNMQYLRFFVAIFILPQRLQHLNPDNIKKSD